MKILKLPLFVLIIAIFITGCGIIKGSTSNTLGAKKIPTTNSSSCSVDTDCEIKRIECNGCGFNLACLNKETTACELNPDKGKSCPPPAPNPNWPTDCRCIESKCVDCKGDECKTD